MKILYSEIKLRIKKDILIKYLIHVIKTGGSPTFLRKCNENLSSYNIGQSKGKENCKTFLS